jgi:regulator of protease activity HflC (stomatin/prohibitin superfamily)
VAQVTLTNLDYSEEFEAVIEATQREEQRVRLAQNELERIRIESERQIVEAEAQRRAAVERARGVAESLEIEVEARANTYRLLSETGLDVATYLFLERWDGKLPQVMPGESTLFSLPALSTDR